MEELGDPDGDILGTSSIPSTPLRKILYVKTIKFYGNSSFGNSPTRGDWGTSAEKEPTLPDL